MNILRHLNLSNACRSADEPIAEETVLEPVAEVAEPVIAEAPEPDPEPEVETPVVAAKPEPHDDKVFRRVIAEVREEKRQERTLREAAEQRASDLQAILERMQAGEKPETIARPAPTTQPNDFQAAVKAQAAAERLREDSTVVRDVGMATFTDFGESLAKLNDVNVMSDEFVADLLAVDKSGAHIIIDKLAKDLHKATSLAGMDSRRRIAELTRMADAPKTEIKPVEAPKPLAISRAPTPKPAISPLSAAPEIDPTTAEGNEKMNDRQFEQWYKAKYIKRA